MSAAPGLETRRPCSLRQKGLEAIYGQQLKEFGGKTFKAATKNGQDVADEDEKNKIGEERAEGAAPGMQAVGEASQAAAAGPHIRKDAQPAGVRASAPGPFLRG